MKTRLQPLQAVERSSKVPKIIIFFTILLFFLDVGFRFVMPDGKAEDLPIHPAEFADLYEPGAYESLKPNLNLEILVDPDGTPFPVETNSFGMRMREVSVEKAPQTARVAVMGDSAAFGWLLPQEQSFAAVLQKILDEEKPAHYEVLNFAAPGYTSFHGLKQYERMVHNFRPEVLVLAFGLYDSFESRVAESELYSLLERHHMTERITGIPRLWHDYSTIGQWVISQRWQKGMEEVIQFYQERKAGQVWKKKVTLEEYTHNLQAIIQHQRSQQGQAILVNLNLHNFYGYDELGKLAEQLDAPLIDIRTLFDQLGGIDERKNAMKLGLEFPGTNEKQNSKGFHFTFRVYVPASVVMTNPIFIVGNHTALGNTTPNQVRMYDDGTHGDERAGDRVWSLKISTERAEPMEFTFTTGGQPGQWPETANGIDNMEKNRLLFHRIDPTPFPDGTHWTSIVYIYGKIPFEHLVISDTNPYPSAMGQTLAAKRAAAALLHMTK
ncbi:MAG: hypothetical protein C4527_04730 [Candidatus Omnitrophota bacterium]|jgi:hypothetical protein|nr:MAG: hypothetical protein C4527_04730 [Candidatus Omnitrophota bacterium]